MHSSCILADCGWNICLVTGSHTQKDDGAVQKQLAVKDEVIFMGLF